jgi:rhodanese-related sulfurtransferase
MKIGEITPQHLRELLAHQPVLVDVRSAKEFQAMHVRHAVQSVPGAAVAPHRAVEPLQVLFFPRPRLPAHADDSWL